MRSKPKKNLKLKDGSSTIKLEWDASRRIATISTGSTFFVLKKGTLYDGSVLKVITEEIVNIIENYASSGFPKAM